MRTPQPAEPCVSGPTAPQKRALTFVVCAVAAAFTAPPRSRPADATNVDLITRPDGQVLTTYPKDGRNWSSVRPGGNTRSVSATRSRAACSP